MRRMGACEEARVAGTVPDALVSFCHLIYAVNKTKYRPVLPTRVCMRRFPDEIGRPRSGAPIHQVVNLKKLELKSASLVPIGATLSDFWFVHRPRAPPWRRADLDRPDR